MKKVRSIRMDDETWELANQRARDADVSVSDLLRALIRGEPSPPPTFNTRPFTPVPKKGNR